MSHKMGRDWRADPLLREKLGKRTSPHLCSKGQSY